MTFPRPEVRLGKRRDRAIILVAAAAWTVFLVVTLLLPRIPRVPLISDNTAGMLGHLVGHFLLVLLFYLLAVAWTPTLVRRSRAAIFSVALSIFLGLSLEAVQALEIVDRAAEMSDVVLTVLGSLAGAVAIALVAVLNIPTNLVAAAIAGSAAGLMAIFGVLAATQDLSLPRVGDHWHADYRIHVCGRQLEPLPATRDGVHTHGGGMIHIHPHEDEQAGRNATFSAFLASSGGSLTEDSLVLPSGERYSNGDRCPDGQPGRLTLTVNGENVVPLTEYVFRNLDEIELRFGSQY